MTTLTLKPMTRTYRNNGQHAEQVYRYTVTGAIAKADNKPATECGDCGNTQVKSARATVCKGTDIISYLAKDAATSYAYVIADCTLAYIMSKPEYIEFVKAFATVTRESKANGGAEKLRLKSESRAMREWLEARV